MHCDADDLRAEAITDERAIGMFAGEVHAGDEPCGAVGGSARLAGIEQAEEVTMRPASAAHGREFNVGRFAPRFRALAEMANRERGDRAGVVEEQRITELAGLGRADL